eukprot:tig00000849_g4778.t1
MTSDFREVYPATGHRPTAGPPPRNSPAATRASSGFEFLRRPEQPYRSGCKMGVCKCRSVSQMYCFCHRTHVCENCICKGHEVCVVRSYLEWVQDSEYEWPQKCPVCQQALEESADPANPTTIRLMCRDVFHVACLDKYAAQFPAHTAPAGYVCPRHPKCATPILPPPEAKSLLATTIRNHVAGAKWAQSLSSASGTSAAASEASLGASPSPSSGMAAADGGDRWGPASPSGSAGGAGGSAAAPTAAAMSMARGVASRKHPGAYERPGSDAYDGEEEDKYRKRSWLKSALARFSGSESAAGGGGGGGGPLLGAVATARERGGTSRRTYLTAFVALLLCSAIVFYVMTSRVPHIPSARPKKVASDSFS